MTSRERVKAALDFRSPDRVPRDLWMLPIAEIRYPSAEQEIESRYPRDFGGSAYSPANSPVVKGSPHAVGEYTDEWGCTFTNIQEGVIGEVKEPLVRTWDDLGKVRPPYELLEVDTAAVNEACAKTDRFVVASCCPRPFERMQFLRGSAGLFFDIMDQPNEFFALRDMLHEYYLKELAVWVQTDVDAILFMDDWGTQHALLIPPPLWRKLYKPLYKDYCDLAHQHGKPILMHSDGHIFEIYQDLIEIGVDAVNSQLFCMDLEEIGHRFKGQITFWGEISRQHVLPAEDVRVARDAVRRVVDALYDPSGGVIAQCEFGPGARKENVMAVFEEWEKLTS